MSDTPRVDAIITGNSDVTNEEYEDLAYLARTLERESAAMRDAIQEAQVALERIKQGCQEDMDSWRDYPQHREAIVGGIGGNKAIAEVALSKLQPFMKP